MTGSKHDDTRHQEGGVLFALLATALASAQQPPQYHDFHLAARDCKGNIDLTDRVWYYHAQNKKYPAVEVDFFDTRPSQARGAAYIKGATSFDLDITLKNENDENVTGSFVVTDARLKVPRNPTGSEDPQTEYYEYISLNFSPSTTAVSVAALGGTQTFTLGFSGLPEHVALGQLQIKYNLPLNDGLMNYDNGTNGGWATWEWVYIVDSAPDGLQEVPWADFLNYTCRWAYGADGEEDVLIKMTRGMHYSNRSPAHRLGYDPGQEWLYISYGETRKLWLARFTYHLDTNDYVWLDCHEFAQLLRAAFHTQGYDGEANQYTKMVWNTGTQTWQAAPFVTNELCVASFDSTNSSNYSNMTFVSHVVVAVSGTRFDASCSYLKDTAGSTYMNPPTFWPYPEWWQNQVGTSYFGLVLRLASSSQPENVGSPTEVQSSATALSEVNGT
jgi:hypothetical protein